MSQPTPEMPDQQPLQDIGETKPKRSTRRRRGRRGGRGRKPSPANSASDTGMMNPPEPNWAEDEQQVSQQLRLLMSPRAPEGGAMETPPVTRDPQLTYTPPASIESHAPVPDREPVSAETFKKSESPVQALMATVGSMAILAAIYHFGVWEGRQEQPDAPTAYASVAAPPSMSITPDPMPSGAEPELTLADNEIPTAEYVPPATESMPTMPLQVDGSEPTVVPARESVPDPAPKPNPVPVAATNVGPSGLYLQVGALEDIAAAHGLERRLRDAGFAVEVLENSQDGWVRVIAGPYDESVATEADARELSRLGIRSFPKRF